MPDKKRVTAAAIAALFGRQMRMRRKSRRTRRLGSKKVSTTKDHSTRVAGEEETTPVLDKRGPPIRSTGNPNGADPGRDTDGVIKPQMDETRQKQDKSAKEKGKQLFTTSKKYFKIPLFT